MTTSRALTALRGLGALALLLAIVVGTPWLLMTIAGSPIPEQIPAWTDITNALGRPDDGTALIALFTVIAWLAWAGFTISVLTQFVAQLRHVKAPHLPAVLAPGIAGKLVAAVLAIGVIGGAATAGAAPALAQTTTSSTQATTATSTSTPTVKTIPKTVTVETGDTLSSISQDEYGDANRWGELFEANKGAKQAGGNLSDPDLIQPGLTLKIPGKTTSITITPPATPAPSAPTDSVESPNAANPPATTPTTPAPTTPAPAPSAAEQAAPDTATTAAPTEEASDSTSVVRTVAGLGTLAAAGVLALLATRRRRQARTRRPGQRINLPTGAAAIAEAQLRVAADPLTVEDLDRTLRALAASAAPQSLPAVRAARITLDEIELYLSDDTAALPEPAKPVPGEPGTWTIARRSIYSTLDPDVPAPYPTLVTLGHDEDSAHLLVNLEELQTLAVDGAAAHEVLTALTLELVSSGWADDVTVTLVGVLPDLADAIGSDRVTYVDTLDEILTGIEHAATVFTPALDEAGVDTPTQARAAGVHPQAWTPHLIVTGDAPAGTDRDRLIDLLEQHPRLSLAAVTHGDAIGDWQVRTTDRDHAVLAPAQIAFTPQVLSDVDLAALLDAFRAADTSHHDGPEWTRSLHDEADLDDLPDTSDLTATPAWLLAGTGAPEIPADQVDDGLAEEIDQPATIEVLNEDGPTEDVYDTNEDQDGIPEPADEPATAENAPESNEEHRDASEAPVVAQGAPEALMEAPTSTIAPSPATAALTTPPADLLPADQPVLRLLGKVRVENTDPTLRPRSPGVALKILTHLAVCPGGGAEELDQSVWPGQEKKHTTRDAPISVARRWLGRTDDGRPYLALWTPDGGYAFDEDMVIDWILFQQLVGNRVGDAPLEDLTRALHLVTGKPLSGARIAETAAESEMIAAIADVAHEVATRALTSGDYTLAAWAAAKGLDAEPVDEALWRDLLRATHQAGDHDKVTELVTRYTTVMDAIGGEYDPDTSELIDQITTPATV